MATHNSISFQSRNAWRNAASLLWVSFIAAEREESLIKWRWGIIIKKLNNVSWKLLSSFNLGRGLFDPHNNKHLFYYFITV
jgi:hypothetical protein